MVQDPNVIRPYKQPLKEKAGFKVLKGNLFDSAIMKIGVISEEFCQRYLSNPKDPNAFEARDSLQVNGRLTDQRFEIVWIEVGEFSPDLKAVLVFWISHKVDGHVFDHGHVLRPVEAAQPSRAAPLCSTARRTIITGSTRTQYCSCAASGRSAIRARPKW
jgi:Dehydratase family